MSFYINLCVCVVDSFVLAWSVCMVCVYVSETFSFVLTTQVSGGCRQFGFCRRFLVRRFRNCLTSQQSFDIKYNFLLYYDLKCEIVIGQTCIT